MENAVLTTTNLSIGYRHKNQVRTIASEINLSLRSGRLVALVGANGIGKSTLLRTITGIQMPIRGAVSLDGKSILSYSALEIAQRISLVLTEKLPPSNLTVFEVVALGRQPYTNWIGKLTNDDITQVKKAMELVQIDQLSDKKHYELSDGQLQKVLIARALAQDTPLIILDEPTTHLDLVHKVSLFRLLKKLTSKTNKSILFSTHDIEMALQLSDEMIVMNSKNVWQQTPKSLIENDILSDLFEDESVTFDVVSQKFVFRNP